MEGVIAVLKIDRAKLRNLMLRQGLNVSELAKAVGMSVTTISELLRQDRFCYFPTVTKLAAVFGIEPSELLIEESK
ncbi:MAG: helix-turn-helix transcriptional regulator [Selenomonadaceae bacterium]|nr:helix-turn-helix transcriptional regulator [Selenomonadaceae bacterium]